MTEKIKIAELEIEVEDISDYESEACDILDSFCEILSKQDGMTRGFEDGDPFTEDDTLFMWTVKAINEYDKEVGRLYSIARKYFGEDCELDITSTWYREE